MKSTPISRVVTRGIQDDQQRYHWRREP